MYNIQDSDHILTKQIKKNHKRFQSDFKKNFAIQEKTLSTLLSGINHAKFNSLKETKVIWNIAGFVNIISYDLKVIGQDLILSESEWQKRYYARQGCLLIYEAINDIFDLLGKEFKTLVLQNLASDEIKNELIKLRRKLNTFKKEHFTNLQSIRNTAIAHRDNDSLKQIKTIVEINWSDTLQLVTTFDNILNHLGEILQSLMNNCLERLDKIE